jgi:glycosyltransferase involved in cell wall biosynthesis
MNNKDITVVMPFMNAEKTIARAVLSVIKQSHSPKQIILIDDGSTDSSIDIVSRYDDNVMLLSDGHNLGLAARLNQGIEMTTTRYLARMDADDIMHPDRLKKQVEYMYNHPKIDILSTGYYLFIDDPFEIVSHTNFEEDCLLEAETIANGSAMLHPSVMGKTAWFKQNSYNVKLSKCQDQELWERTVKFSNFARLADRLMYYRIDHPININKIIETQLCVAKIAKSISNYKIRTNKLKKAYSKVLLYKSCQLLGLGDYISGKRLNRLPKDRVLIQNATKTVKDMLQL